MPLTAQPDSSTPSAPLPPGQMGLPFVGETLQFFRDRNFGSKRHAQYGDVFKTQILGQPTIFVKGAAANQFILTHENEYFQVQWPPSTAALLGDSLATQMGDMHQSRRKLLAQAFMPRALSGYIAAMEQITAAYTQGWVQQKTLTWYPSLRRYTLDVACKLLVGLEQGADTALGHWFEEWCKGLFTLPINLPWTRFGKALRCRDRLLTEIAAIIRTRQAAANPGQDALGLLIQAEDEAGQKLTADELKDQILLLLFAGHETLTSHLSTFCLQTALHPEVTERLRAEQAAFADQPLTLDTFKQMPYLEQVFKEVLRITPPVGGVFRKILQPCIWDGYQLPAGWSVLCQINTSHADPATFPNPDRFDPDRFDPLQAEKQAKYSYVPFGGGIRECLGKEFARLEAKLFACHLLRNYRWELLPDQDLELVVIPTPMPRDGLRVHFSRLVPC